MKLLSKLFLMFIIAFLLVSTVMAGIVFTESQRTYSTNKVNVAAVSSETTYFYVDPPEVKDVMPGENFKININITDAPPTFAWYIRLSWDPGLLNLTDVEEGDFLDRRYWDPDWEDWVYPYATSFVYVPLDEANENGSIMIGCSLLGNLTEEEWASGDGWLCTLNFLVEAKGNSVLNLYETRLADHLDEEGYPAFTYYPNLDGFFSNFHDIAIINVTASTTEVAKPYPVSINVTVTNEGDFSETFNVTTYYDGMEIDTLTNITLEAEANTTLTFTWDTTYVPATTTGTTYNISAKSSELPYEANTTNNRFIDGNVTVYKPPGPSANFTYLPETPIEGEPVNLDASLSTPDPITNAPITSYAWDFGDGTTEIYVDANLTDTATHPYAEAGSYTVKLNVTDSEGLWDAAEATVTVYRRDVAIVSVTLDETEVTIGEPVSIDVTVKNEGDFTETFNVTAYYDDTNIGTINVPDLAPGASTTLTFTWDTTNVSPGAYTIKANATVVEGETEIDDNEMFFDDTVTVKAPPVASFTHTPSAPVVGETVTFNASASIDPDGSIDSWNWNFGDGTYGNGEIVTHTYAIAGDLMVILTVTDNDGLTDAEEKEITIGKTSSNITISASPATITVGANVTINGTISPTRQDVNVMIQYRLSGETEWNTLAAVKTDSTGSYEYTWTPETAGTYEIKASWSGDENTLAAESDMKTVTVEEVSAPAYGIQLYVLAAIAIIIAAAIVIYIVKIR